MTVDPALGTPLKGRGGPGRGQGRKPGPHGPADKRLNLKLSAQELRWYDDAAAQDDLPRSEWVRTRLNRAAFRELRQKSPTATL